MAQLAPLLLAGTITKLDARARGAVIVSGSHGGVYPAYLACQARVSAVVLHDAGGGKDQAGIGCLGYCDQRGVAAATVAHGSARIGDADDVLARGVLSHVNLLATHCGCHPGMTCAAAIRHLQTAVAGSVVDLPGTDQPGSAEYAEARLVLERGERRIVCIDSASLVEAADAQQIVVTGSHGGLIGGDPAMALRVDAYAAIFNDAGIGIDDAGVTRLPALDDRGIAAATVATASARIGDARSTLEHGILSRVNQTAAKLTGRPGMAAREFVDRLLKQID